MTRIIAGDAGSVILRVPPSGTRPTSDRVREAIFSALAAREAIAGARVLDLFAGSGALGLEALSRGATDVTLVEADARAASTCRANTALVLKAVTVARGGVEARVERAHVLAWLERARATRSAAECFDLVFADPPYAMPMRELSEALDALGELLNPNAVVVVETSARVPVPELPDGLAIDRERAYGDTRVVIAYRL